MAEDLRTSMLEAHNRYRANHNAPPLEWDDGLAAYAQRQADECEARSMLFHGNNPNQGQNAFMSYPPSSGDKATSDWYSEIRNYDFGSHRSNGGAVGHFTQVVWRGTTKIGAGRSASGQFIVANYSPPGNYMGEEPRNVFPPGTDMSPVEDEPPVAQGGMPGMMTMDGMPGMMTMDGMPGMMTMEGMMPGMQGISMQGMDMGGMQFNQMFSGMQGMQPMDMQGMQDQMFGAGMNPFGGMDSFGQPGVQMAMVTTEVGPDGQSHTVRSVSNGGDTGQGEIRDGWGQFPGMQVAQPVSQNRPIGFTAQQAESEPMSDQETAVLKFQAAREKAKSRSKDSGGSSLLDRVKDLEEQVGVEPGKGLAARVKNLELEILGEVGEGSLGDRVTELEGYM
eukprot:TRINITY_DN2858_c0_g1_i2.p1 TRINITY_DN2858_c0_g1~~TRINITY_DN2858_c0_g1_i2.p1  ORF type:complete len:392 (+),score=66.42 TRINITY_DN2858_c0_g1_i2:172-1347(+)